MTQVELGGKVVRSFTFTVFPAAPPFSRLLSSSTMVCFVVTLVAPLADDERNALKGTHGASARSPPTTAKSVRNLRLLFFAGAPAAGRGGGGGAGGALLLVSFSDI